MKTSYTLRSALRLNLAILVGLGLLCTQPAFAQDAEADSTLGWTKSLVGTLSGTQAGYNNWQEGGINSLAFGAALKGNADNVGETWESQHELRFNIGLLKQDTLDVRKADDLIQLTSAFKLRGQDFWATFKPTIGFSLRTQFASGFDYGQQPEVKVSEFFSPAFLTQSVGLSYEPSEWFNQRFGFATKETVVNEETLRANFGNDPDETVRFEAGADLLTSVKGEIAENVLYTGTLGIFAGFQDFGNPDIRWENTLLMKVNDWLTINFEFVTFYDRDISTAAQFKEVLSAGVSVTLI